LPPFSAATLQNARAQTTLHPSSPGAFAKKQGVFFAHHAHAASSRHALFLSFSFAVVCTIKRVRFARAQPCIQRDCINNHTTPPCLLLLLLRKTNNPCFARADPLQKSWFVVFRRGTCPPPARAPCVLSPIGLSCLRCFLLVSKKFVALLLSSHKPHEEE
jgi:hypothetical protein